jgi:hypothetical protein
MRIKQVIGLVILFIGFFSIPSPGQVVATWTDSSGNWSNSANWSTLTVPDNGGGKTYDAVINGTGADTVTFDASGTVINSLTLGTGETFQDNGLSSALRVGSLTNLGTINWQNGSNLTVNGTFNNNLTGNTTVNITGLSTLRTGDINNSGVISIDASHLMINGDYFFPGFGGGTLQLQNGSIGTVTGSIESDCNCSSSGIRSISVDHSSLNVGGGFSSGQTTVNGGTLRVQGGLEVLEGGALNLQGSSAVINGRIGGVFATFIQIDNSSLIAGGIFISQQGGEAFF